MFDQLQVFILSLGLDSNSLFMVGIGFGSVLGLVGLYSAFSGPEDYVRRFRPTISEKTRAEGSADIIRKQAAEPSALMKALVPAEREQRTRIERQLAHAGFTGKDVVLNFFLLRALVGIVLPGTLLGIIYLDTVVPVPWPFSRLAELSQLQTMQFLAILVAGGFYGPAWWLKSKVANRQRAISEAFPNALDLLQISVEAGLGFDAAIARVAEEMRAVSPAIAEEFTIAQSEVLAGRDREKALFDMADRMGIDEARAFATVVLQSKRFGTNISEALLTYADEMRRRRELKAQEKANRLPVQMSAVMGCLMLPALFMIALSPVVIRYMRYFGE